MAHLRRLALPFTIVVLLIAPAVSSASITPPGSLCSQQTISGGPAPGAQTVQVDCWRRGTPDYFQAPTRTVGTPTMVLSGAAGADSDCGGPDWNGECRSGGRGNGAVVHSPLALNGADYYQVRVGGAGTDSWYSTVPGGYNGGGSGTGFIWSSGSGGGATDVRAGSYGLGDRLLVAGGGGGAGGAGWEGGFGGPGAWITGGDGGNPNASYLPRANGLGGGQSAGGAGGQYSNGLNYNQSMGQPGVLGTGGAGACGLSPDGLNGCGGHGGGGGGGGYYGGGGGNEDGGGGGGGSSLAPAGATVDAGANGGDGHITLTYVSDGPVPLCSQARKTIDRDTSVSVSLDCIEPTGELHMNGYAIASQPAHGTVTLTNAVGGTATYTPAAGFVGTDTFTYRNSTANGDSRPTSVSVDVVPVCRDVSAHGVGEATVRFDCTPGDFMFGYDPGYTFGSSYDNPLGYYDVFDKVLHYDFPDEFIGTRTFTYQLSTLGETSGPATVTVTADPPPVPACTAANATTRGGEPVTVALGCTSHAGYALSEKILTQPAHGTLTAPAGGSVTYTPAPGYEGVDHFTYYAGNRGGYSTVKTVDISVTAPVPPATCDGRTLILAAGHSVTMALHCSAPVAGYPSRFLIATAPGHGQLTTIDQNAGTVTYTADADYEGADSFEYAADSSATPGSGGGRAEVTITVTANPPVCDPVDLQDGQVGVARTIQLGCVTPAGHAQAFAINTQPAHGTLSDLDAQAGTVTYTPQAGYRGADNFKYSASSDRGASAPATVSVFMHQPQVTCAAKTLTVVYATATPVAMDCENADQVTITGQPAHGELTELDTNNGTVVYTPDDGFDGADSFTFTGANHDHTSAPATASVTVAPNRPGCRDSAAATLPATAVAVTLGCAAKRDPVTITILDGPSHGTLTGLDPQTGRVTYTPERGFAGTDRVTYRAAQQDRSSDTAALTITVGVPSAPVCAAIERSAIATVSQTVTLRCSTTDGFPLTFALTGGPAHGTITPLDAAAGTFAYTPNANYAGSDQLSYTATNAGGTSAPALITISVALPESRFKLPPVTKTAGGSSIRAAFTFPGKGRLTLTLKEPIKGSTGGKRRTLSTARVISSAGPGQQTVAVKLNKLGRRILAREGKLKVTLVIAFRPVGGVERTRTQTFTLHAPKR